MLFKTICTSIFKWKIANTASSLRKMSGTSMTSCHMSLSWNWIRLKRAGISIWNGTKTIAPGVSPGLFAYY